MDKNSLKKGIVIGLISALSYIGGCDFSKPGLNNPPPLNQNISLEEKLNPIYSHYGENVFYQDLSKIDFNELGKSPKNVPEYFLKVLEKPKIKNAEEFRKLVLEEASKLGYSKKEISNLQAESVIRLASKIVANKITYKDVDSKDSEFFKKYGKIGHNFPHDEIFKIGEGDCDKYAMLTIGVLNFFKEFNPNLTNIYFSNAFGMHENDLALLHEWVSVICMYKSKILLSQIDPTFYDDGKKLEAQVGWHLPNDPERIRAFFYAGIKEDSAALLIHQKVLDKEERPIKRAEIYNKLAFLAYMLHDKRKVEEVRENYFKERLGKETGDRATDAILYYSYLIEKDTGNQEKAQEFKERLISEFPDSYWVEWGGL